MNAKYKIINKISTEEISSREAIKKKKSNSNNSLFLFSFSSLLASARAQLVTQPAALFCLSLTFL